MAFGPLGLAIHLAWSGGSQFVLQILQRETRNAPGFLMFLWHEYLYCSWSQVSQQNAMQLDSQMLNLLPLRLDLNSQAAKTAERGRSWQVVHDVNQSAATPPMSQKRSCKVSQGNSFRGFRASFVMTSIGHPCYGLGTESEWKSPEVQNILVNGPYGSAKFARIPHWVQWV